MNDQEILALYNRRDERAIEETGKQYSAYCWAIAYRILSDKEDAEECVNDTWLRAWNAIPPEQPHSLAAYLGTVTRHLAYDRYRQRKRQKRGGGEMALTLEEIGTFFTTEDDPADACNAAELATYINRFLDTLKPRERNLLLGRYYFVYPTEKLARHYGLSEKHVRTILSRTLKKLKQFLEKESYL